MLPWFHDRFPLYLAPMAGVTDKIFRQLCKEQGADVLVTEFVSADGILHRNERTRRYVDFDAMERPLGVQLFGANPERLGEAARQVIDWVAPDFIDLNFGCPVNKVVCKNGGSALLKDCPLLERVATEVVRAAAPVPVTAKIRIGWDRESINAPAVTRILEGCGIAAVAVHGRTRSQGYSGEADWEVIGHVAESVSIPVIGNGDLSSGADIEKRRRQFPVAGVMIGRAAMSAPWIFRVAKEYLRSGRMLAPPSLEERWDLIERHCQLAVERQIRGEELATMSAMRSRLMAYSRGMPESKRLRLRFSKVASLAELRDIAGDHLVHSADAEKDPARRAPATMA